MKIDRCRFFAVAALSVMALGASAAPTAPAAVVNPLRVTLLASSDGAANIVEVTVTNASSRSVRIPKWQLPSAYSESDLFRVVREGEQARYTGRLVKRPLPAAADYAVLRPGEARHTRVDLSAAYDLREGGLHTVTYSVPLQYASLSDGKAIKAQNGGFTMLQSAPMLIRIDAAPAAARKGSPPNRTIVGTPASNARNIRALIGDPPISPIDANARCIPGIRGCDVAVQATYIGCSADRQDLIKQAISGARGYSENAKGYLNAANQGARYTAWFGAYLSARYGSAQQNFAKIDAAMDLNQGQITVDCTCTESYYAYVYPNDPYRIYVCNAFWSAPMLGTDSKAGTLIHEMSHFDVVAGTNDWVYGQSGARNLANTNPNQASGNYSVSPIVYGNADNHEYFAENTPAQN